MTGGSADAGRRLAPGRRGARAEAGRSAAAAAAGGRAGEVAMVDDAEFTSYYGRPIIKPPVWKTPDVPLYLFLGGRGRVVGDPRRARRRSPAGRR